MGIVQNPDVQMQLDTGGAYDELQAAVSHFQEGTCFYRKIQGLENDPLFLRLILNALRWRASPHLKASP
jgi:hypothetical protein